MRLQLVFLHGIGRPRNADQERKGWAKALAEGALRAGHSRVARSLEDDSLGSVSFAYYGDLFVPAQGQGTNGLGFGDAEAQILLEMMCALIDGQLPEATGDRERRALAQSRAQLITVGQAQGSGNAVRRAINAATTLLSVVPLRRAGEWTAPKLMVGELAQVARYLARNEADAERRHPRSAHSSAAARGIGRRFSCRRRALPGYRRGSGSPASVSHVGSASRHTWLADLHAYSRVAEAGSAATVHPGVSEPLAEFLGQR